MTKVDSCFPMSPVKQVIIGNTRKDTTIDDLKDCFSPLIKKEDVLFKIAVDKKGKQKGFAAASVPIGLLEDFLGYNGRNMKGHRITVVLGEDFKVSKSTRWQQEESGIFKTPPPSQYSSAGFLPFLYPMFDAGVYLTHPKFNKNVVNVIKRAQTCGVKKMVVLGSNVKQCEQALSLCKVFSGALFCTAGVGPKNAAFWNDDAESQLTQIASTSHCVAIGECGFDLSTDDMSSTLPQQLEAFEKQIQLAIKVKKPLVVVQKKAHVETLSLLKRYRTQLVDVVMMCYPDNQAQIDDYVKEGFYIYINGSVFLPKYPTCLKKWLSDSELRKDVPFDRLLLSSAAPYHSVVGCTDIDWYSQRFSDETQHKSFDVMLNHCKDTYSEPCSLPSMLVMMSLTIGSQFSPRSLSDRLSRNTVTFFRLGGSVKEVNTKGVREKFSRKKVSPQRRSFLFTTVIVSAIVVLIGIVFVRFFNIRKVEDLYHLF